MHQPSFNDVDRAQHIERTRERIRERYMAAVRAARFGSSPTVRAAAKAEALRLRKSVHGF